MNAEYENRIVSDIRTCTEYIGNVYNHGDMVGALANMQTLNELLEELDMQLCRVAETQLQAR